MQQPWDEALPARPAKRRPAGIVAVTLAVVAVLIAGVGAVVAMTGQDANTPDQAVRGLLTAVSNSDVLGVLDHVDPSERDVLSGFLSGGTADLQRLGILSSGADLHHVGGVSISFDGLTTSTTELRPGLDAVKLTGGTVHSRVDPAQLPLGPFVRQHAGPSLGNAKAQDRTEPIHLDTAIVTVRRGDTWYVSLGYTAAEAARTAAKAPLPRPQDAVPAVGADSATAAVDAFVRALAALDVQRLIELTPPDEMGALHEYAPLFLPKLSDSIAKLRNGTHPFSVTITRLDLTSEAHGGGELVKIAAIGVHVTAGGVTVDYDPGAKCVTVSGLGAGLGGFAVPGICGASGTTPPKSPFPTGLHAGIGIVAVQRDGKWYVSPLRTVLDDLEAVLHALTPAQLDQIKSGFNPLAFLGASSTAHLQQVSGATAIPMQPPVTTLCVNGKRTITFPAAAGRPTLPPMTIPCRG